MMTAPDRIWAFFNGPMVGLFVGREEIGTNVAGYVRADIARAEADALRAAGADLVKANGSLMLMLTGEIPMTKPTLEAELRRSLDAQNAWANTLKGGVE